MKKIIFTLCVLMVSGLLVTSSAQNCGINNSSVCDATGGGGLEPGFGDLTTIPCAEQGVAYSHTIKFTMFTDFNFQGAQDVDSIELQEIRNLPCGLCWAADQEDRRYSAGEDGCIKFTGTTAEPAGQYKLGIYLRAWINKKDSAYNIPGSLTDQTGVRLFIRVKTPGGSCANLDTTTNFPNNLSQAFPCTVGINELNSSVSSLSVMPNPMNNEAVVSFVSEVATDYTIRVTDVTGREVLVKQVEAKTGDNRVTIQRNSLPAGVYFMVLSDGKNALTRRFSITD